MAEHSLSRPHKTRNANVVHKSERQGLNDLIAVFLTRVVGSMPTAYLFIIIALIGLAGIIGLIPPVVALLIAWLSQTLIQLVLLPVIMVGQNVLNRHQELQAEEQFKYTENSYHDIEAVLAHLERQDAQLLNIEMRIESMLQKVDLHRKRPPRRKETTDDTTSH